VCHKVTRCKNADTQNPLSKCEAAFRVSIFLNHPGYPMRLHHSIGQPSHTGYHPLSVPLYSMLVNVPENTGGTVWHTIPWNKWLPHISLHRRDRKWSGNTSHHQKARKQSASLLQRKKAGRQWNMFSRVSSVVCACPRISSRKSPGHLKKSLKICYTGYPFFSYRYLPGYSWDTGIDSGSQVPDFLLNQIIAAYRLRELWQPVR